MLVYLLTRGMNSLKLMAKKSTLIQTIKIPKINDDCWLYFAEYPKHIPFKIERIYYITQAKKNLPRGFHAHHKTRQVLFCIQGSIKMIFDDGKKKASIILKKPEIGTKIYIFQGFYIFISVLGWVKLVRYVLCLDRRE